MGARIAMLEASKDTRVQSENIERQAEMLEAMTMSGAGPWRCGAAVVDRGDGRVGLRESGIPLISQGAYGDLELALQNVEWRREVQISWLEFSRWGIEQIIRISRLYYIKNPIIRRLIDICAIYVFGRGFEISSADDTANEAIKQICLDNPQVFGQVSLTDQERRKQYDGNLFWIAFADTALTGRVKFRTIDPLEILEIITDPDDVDCPQLYRRSWTQKVIVAQSATPSSAVGSQNLNAWYPAMGFDPAAIADGSPNAYLKSKPAELSGYPIMWETPIYHRAVGKVSKWLFGCPPIYPALDWAKESRKYLEAIASVKQSLSQIALQWKTKGGQQAIQGIKGQIQTTVNTTSQIWDQNPTAVAGSSIVTGPGTDVTAFAQRSAAGNPEEVRRYLLMCCMCIGVPETFLADVSTGNLATATTLDRPTELAFLEKQEQWREDLVYLMTYALRISSRAPKGLLREAMQKRGLQAVTITEAKRIKAPNGRMVYEAADPQPGVVEVKCTFPAIREGDIPALVGATVEAMTLGNRGGQIVGIDAKCGAVKLAELLDIPDPQEMAEDLYPDETYDPDRSQQDLIQPIGRAKPQPAGTQINPKTGETTQIDPNDVKEAKRLIRELGRYANGVEHSNAR